MKARAWSAVTIDQLMSVTLSDGRVSKVIEEICLLTVDFFNNKGGTAKTFSSLDTDLSRLRDEKVFLLETPKRSFKGKEELWDSE